MIIQRINYLYTELYFGTLLECKCLTRSLMWRINSLLLTLLLCLNMLSMKVNLSTVQEDDEEREETRRTEQNSASFVSGAQAINRINEDEMTRRKKHEFIENDPRFNNTFNPKEHSWEPSPYHSRIEERGDQENHPLRGDSRSILPSSFDTSKSNRSANKSVKFSEKTETRVLTPLSSSESATTLITSNERVTAVKSRTKTTQGDLPSISSSSHPSTVPLKGIPSSPSESIVSTASSVYVSTPNDRLSKQQISRSLRARFSDISAIEGTGKSGNHSGGFLSLPSQDSKQIQRGPLPPTQPSSNDTLTNSDIINIVQHTDKTANLMSALDNARKQPKKMRKVDFSQSVRSTRSSVGGGEEPRSTISSCQPSLTPLYSSTNMNISSNRPLSTTFITNSSMKESIGRGGERGERLPDVSTSMSSRREMSMRNESMSTSSRRETSMRNEENGGKERLPEIRPSIRIGEKNGEMNRQNGISSLPPRPPLRSTHRINDEPLRRNETNTSTCSGVSSRSCQSDLDRVDSRAENVTSGASNKSDRLVTSEMRELDFGFVNVGDSRIITFKARSALDIPVTCHYSLKSDTKQQKERKREPLFTILDGTEVIIQPRGDICVKVEFTPQKDCKHMDKLNISLSGGGFSQRFGIKTIGSGGRAHLELVKRPGLLVHRSGDHVLTTDSDGPITLGMENVGKRSMYVRAVVLDGYGKKMEGDIFSPSHSFVIGANVKQPLKVDISRVRMNDSGRCTSSLSSVSGMGIRRSSTTSVNSIGSSASSVHLTAPITNIVDDDSDQDRTLIADDTFRGNETMISMMPDLTVLKIQR
ncbi:hypothetical protein PRIPAC_84014 [Pristionchus pacificus]|uniref:Uncharacterized protein n=1 Tax=Pristionchus pacificus TaxID=54126 RepID=A0A2A6C4W5_PRIPA|nr:hypothetical protein PRIPAC_84014 [Pristionchus pacificus]|eukprot:PDM73156.1 hypothetical protein PRIPAC_43252 [Pristionchus pacificus]